MWRLSLITAPTKEPLGIYGSGTPAAWDLRGDVYQHLRLTPTTDMAPLDPMLKGMVAVARVACEAFTGRQLMDATWELILDSWWEEGIYRDGALHIPLPPLRTITSVKYLDTGGTEQTLGATTYLAETQATATVDVHCQKGRLYLKYAEQWPSLRCQPEAVKIRFTCGYGSDPASVPWALRQGMLLMIGEMYERREVSVVGGIITPAAITAERLWWPFRAW